jgi:t-SNARE complex subunit (syntaxin)
VQGEKIISSYILRLTRKGQVVKVGLQNVKTGQTQHFENIEALIAHLEQLQLNFEDLPVTSSVARAPPRS